MKKTLALLAIAAAVLSSCGEGKTEEETDSVQAEIKPEPKSIVLKEFQGEKLGFTIQAPEGSIELKNNEFMWTYTHILSDGINEINVTVVKSTGDLKTIEDAVQYISFGTTPAVKEKKNLGEDFLIVKDPQGSLQETWYFAKSKAGHIIAKVTAPISQAEIASKIAATIKAK